MIKGKGQRLIPEELLKYLEAYKEAHPDPTQGGGATLDDIVDSAGNPRFIEGDGTNQSISGIETKYNKWSLSGTHLMCVLAGSTTASTSIYVNLVLSSYTIPKWIGDKIYATFGSTSIENKILSAYSTDGTIETVPIRIIKTDDTHLAIIAIGNQTITANRGFRVQFDLLIDAEYS